MKLDVFLNLHKVNENTKEKPVTHTLMNNGKYHIPNDKLDKLYKKIEKYAIRENNNIQLVEKMGDIHPLISDIDIKYDFNIENRQYNNETISKIISFLSLNLKSLLDLSDKKLLDVWIMEKEKPYPCKSKKYKYKDGIHIVFPNILIKKQLIVK